MTRLTLTLDTDTGALLARLSAHSGLSPAAIIAKVLPAHLEELHTHDAWLEAVKDRDPALYRRGSTLLHSYGPTTLTQDMEAIDPAFAGSAQRLRGAQ